MDPDDIIGGEQREDGYWAAPRLFEALRLRHVAREKENSFILAVDGDVPYIVVKKVSHQAVLAGFDRAMTLVLVRPDGSRGPPATLMATDETIDLSVFLRRNSVTLIEDEREMKLASSPDLKALEKALTRRKRTGRHIHVVADDDVSFREVAAAIVVCQSAGFTDLSLSGTPL